MDKEAPKGDIFFGEEPDKLEREAERRVTRYLSNWTGILEVCALDSLLETFNSLNEEVDEDVRFERSWITKVESVNGVKQIVSKSTIAFVSLNWQEDGIMNQHEVRVLGGGKKLVVIHNGEAREFDFGEVRRLRDEELEEERA